MLRCLATQVCYSVYKLSFAKDYDDVDVLVDQMCDGANPENSQRLIAEFHLGCNRTRGMRNGTWDQRTQVVQFSVGLSLSIKGAKRKLRIIYQNNKA